MEIPPAHVMQAVERFVAFAFIRLESEEMCLIETERTLRMGRVNREYSVVFLGEVERAPDTMTKLTQADVLDNHDAFIELSKYMHNTYVDAQEEYRDDAKR